MKSTKKYIFILSELFWTRQPPATTRAIQVLCRGFTVIYCARTYLSWYRALVDGKARRALISNFRFFRNKRFYSVVVLEWLPFGRHRFVASVNDFLFSLSIRIMSSLFLLYETFARSESAILTVWFFNPKHYPLISVLYKHNILLDTLDYFRLKPDTLGAFLVRYTSSALIYRSNVPLTSMERSMKLIRWTAEAQKRLQKTSDALRKVLLS